mgnify:CR=1 FL=1
MRRDAEEVVAVRTNGKTCAGTEEAMQCLPHRGHKSTPDSPSGHVTHTRTITYHANFFFRSDVKRMSRWVCAVSLLLAAGVQAQEETYVQVGVLVGGLVGILCAGVVCVYAAYRLSRTIKQGEAQERLKRRNERRERLGLSKLKSATTTTNTETAPNLVSRV